MNNQNLSKHPLYKVWNQMKDRCYNPNNPKYNNYGGKGVSVCDRWKSFCFFYVWAIDNGWEKGLSIDRKDGNGDYEPGNCRIVTIAENNRNRIGGICCFCDRDVAKFLGVSDSMWSMFRHNKRNISKRKAKLIEGKTGIDSQYIIEAPRSKVVMAIHAFCYGKI